ncbi:MAG TPA: hypothetical protein VGF86_05385 [Candidatus Tumulicola sp.]
MSDFMLTLGDYTVTREATASKTAMISDGWLLSFAGDATTYYEVFNKAVPRLVGDAILDAARIATVVDDTYREVREKRKADVLGMYSFALSDEREFRRKGLRWVGPGVHASICERLDRWDRTEFMIGGQGEIVSVDAGGIESHSQEGFYAIGIGDEAARHVLYRTYDENLDAATLGARLLHAKFSAEGAHVGRKSIVISMERSGKVRSAPPAVVDAILDRWRGVETRFTHHAAKRIERAWSECP